MSSRFGAFLLTLALAIPLAADPARAELDPIPYVVARGDTALRIAARHRLSLAQLRALNRGVDLERLRTGQRLIVGEGRRVVHRLRRGETLAMVADRYGVEVREILAWNASLTPGRLVAGRELQIWARRDEPLSESVGRVDAGFLLHGIPIPSHPGYVVRDRERAYVTRHVAELLARGFDAVLARYPRAPRVEVRDASRSNGGPLREHRSHQSGRDVDLAYYRRRCPGRICRRAWVRPETLDAELQWALLEPWLREGVVEYAFIDHSLQEPLYAAALAAGASAAELSAWFQYPRGPEVRAGIIRHEPSHADHVHVRFVCARHDARCVPSNGRNAVP
jgi:hypothetical protein